MAQGRKTPAHVLARVDELLASDVSVSEISAIILKELKYKIGRGPIDKQALVLAKNRRQGRPADDGLAEKIAALRAENKKPAEIALQLGVGRTLVYYYISKMPSDGESG